MIRRAPLSLTLPLALLLSACGVGGPPVPPSQAPAEAREPNVTIGGAAGIGVGGRF